MRNVNLYQIYDYTFDITHLDSRVIRITKEPGDSLHLQDSLRKISGQGMPVYKQENVFGDLFIRFDITIPKSITPDSLSILKQIFGEQETPLTPSGYSKQFVLEYVSETDIEELQSETDSEESLDSNSDDSLDSEESDSVSSEDSESPPPVRHKRR